MKRRLQRDGGPKADPIRGRALAKWLVAPGWLLGEAPPVRQESALPGRIWANVDLRNTAVGDTGIPFGKSDVRGVLAITLMVSGGLDAKAATRWPPEQLAPSNLCGPEIGAVKAAGLEGCLRVGGSVSTQPAIAEPMSHAYLLQTKHGVRQTSSASDLKTSRVTGRISLNYRVPTDLGTLRA